MEKEKEKLEPKRRRVTRACDICRLKKVKCDGKQPCIHCTVYSYSCTYDQPNIRNKRNSGIPLPANPLTNIYGAGRPGFGGASSGPDQLVLAQNMMRLLFPKLKANMLDHSLTFDFDRFQKIVQGLQAKGHVTLNEISESYLDGQTKSPVHSPTLEIGSVNSEDWNSMGREIKIDLPSKEVALQLIHTCWDKGCVLFRFYHRPSLLEEVDLLYSLDPFNFTDRQQKFLPFLYSVLACGSLFSRLSDIDSLDNEALQGDGFKYFLEARKLIDITNAGDIISIQTIVMMIIYLQCSARLSTCYSYIGIALRNALKEGLHRNSQVFQSTRRGLDPIEADTRKRVFYTIYKMDIYINSLLGLPISLNEDEFDQPLPADLDDENVTREGFNTELQGGRLSSSGCANYHTTLIMIMSHIVRDLYPIKVKKLASSPPETNDSQTPNHMHRKVSALEFELKAWLDQLPTELKPVDPNHLGETNSIPPKFLLANYYLHLSFLNCQIMLYRPFIHFISHGNDSRATDPRSLIRGRNCIKVARSVVKLANKMIDQNLLVGTYWFSMYTIFFSIACLIYYYHFVHSSHNGNDYNSQTNYAGVLFDDDLNLEMIKKDIEIGKKVLDTLKDNSEASSRIYNMLNKLFEQLNRRTAVTSKDISQLLASTPKNAISNSQIRNTILTFDLINRFSNLPIQESDPQTQQPDLFQLENGMNDPRQVPDKNAYSSYPLRQASSEPVQSLPQPLLRQLLLQPPGEPPTSNDQSAANTSLFENAPVKLEPLPNEVDLNQNQFQQIQDLNANYNGMDPTQPEFLPKDTEENSYIPGIIDKFDSQIFGRMLPPYMLEGQSRPPQRPNDVNFENISEIMNGDFGSPGMDFSPSQYGNFSG